MSQTVRITTGARLHFGLLDVTTPFGGCGVMIDTPETIVQFSESPDFTFSQSDGGLNHQDRATDIARRIVERLGTAGPLPRAHVRVLCTAPAHTGLGSGTQLSLAIAEGLIRVSDGQLSSGRESKLATELSNEQRAIWLQSSDRGRRSAVGTYGYLNGGLILEGFGPPDDGAALNTLHERLELPSTWRVAIILPATRAIDVVYGDQEQAKFNALRRADSSSRESLKAILSERLIPAIRAGDFADFCVATHQYNHDSGLLFADVQGGPYNGAATTRLIADLRGTGLAGVGQSSWGPGVFAWFPNDASAAEFRRSLSAAEYRVFIARPLSTGRRLETVTGD
jgi:beta-RFAP synthase